MEPSVRMKAPSRDGYADRARLCRIQRLGEPRLVRGREELEAAAASSARGIADHL